MIDETYSNFEEIANGDVGGSGTCRLCGYTTFFSRRRWSEMEGNFEYAECGNCDAPLPDAYR